MNSSIVTFWNKLKTVQAVTLRHTKEDGLRGFAKVLITSEEEQTILFNEKGEWENRKLSFTNTLRWTLHSDGISLEHLRFGSQFPVHLVHFTPTTQNCLASKHSHLCGRDRYSAQVFWNQDSIYLSWSIQGPQKNEGIYSLYR